jgi:two-component system response regulator HydG
MSVGPVIYIADLPTQIQNHELGLRREAHTQRIQTQVRPDHAVASVISLADIEKQAIVGAIRRLKGDKLLAASLLGIGKTTLYRKLKEYGLSENVPLELLER